MGTMNKLTKIVLSFLMVITCINFSTVQAEDGEEVNYSEPTTVETVSEDPANEVEQEGAQEEPTVEEEATVELANNDYTAIAATILEGLGGKANITSVDNCITRLRLEVKDNTVVNEKKIKEAGVAGVIRPGKTSVQVVIGPKVQFVADEFKKLCQ